MSKEWDAVEYWKSLSLPGQNFDGHLRALAAEARKQALMEAAAICTAKGSEWHADYKLGNGPHRASPHREGMSDGAHACADAIERGM